MFLCLSSEVHTQKKKQTKLKSILMDLIWLKVLRNSSMVPYLFFHILTQFLSHRGLDYIAASGSESYLNMITTVKTQMMARANTSEDLAAIKKLETGLKEAHRHLKQDYKNEIRKSSNVAGHCINFSLSDPKERHFSFLCDHQHSSYCVHCESRSKLHDIYSKLVDKLFPADCFEDRNVRFQREEDLANIAAWISHEVRGVAQNEKIKKIVELLTDDQVAYLEFDLAMKWLPRKFR